MQNEKEKEKRGDVKKLLGKRQRTLSITRTKSMTKFDLNCEPDGDDPGTAPAKATDLEIPAEVFDRTFTAVSTRPKIQRRNSAEAAEKSHFLKACSLCNRRLIPARDIYMYRGDSAFCSLECRQQQINQDERKEKCSLATKKEAVTIATSSEVSTNGETLTAV